MSSEDINLKIPNSPSHKISIFRCCLVPLFLAILILGLAYHLMLGLLSDSLKKLPELLVSAVEAGAPAIGTVILKEKYADPDANPEQDLDIVFHVLDNFSLLVKGDDPLPLGANEDIAAALRGKNKARLRFLPDDSPVFDNQGRLIDRWGSPLFFHANSRDWLDIRSAGPDKRMWTADDLHRRHDGSFLRGDHLNAPSLFEAADPANGSLR